MHKHKKRICYFNSIILIYHRFLKSHIIHQQQILYQILLASEMKILEVQKFKKYYYENFK